MAKSSNNVVTHGLSGKIGDLLVFSQRDGKTIVSNKPRKSNKVSEGQKEQRKKFQRAQCFMQRWHNHYHNTERWLPKREKRHTL